MFGILRPGWLFKMKRGHIFPGFWLNFESGEGSGKGTHINLLRDYLKNKKFFVEIGREPGETKVGEIFRNILQNPKFPELDFKTEMLIYVASGIELFTQKIKPVLSDGGIFVTDRWRYSTLAYQGYGLGIDLDLIERLIKFSCDNCYPDITFLIDIDPKIGLLKASQKKEFSSEDKIEARTLEYHKKVNKGYMIIAKDNPSQFRVIPYINDGIDAMQNQIREEVYKFILNHNLEDKLKRIKN